MNCWKANYINYLRNKKYEYNGKQYSSKELAKLSPYPDITHHTITDRINSGGWTVENAIFTPIRKIERDKQKS